MEQKKVTLNIELDSDTFDLFEAHSHEQHDMTFKAYMEEFLASYAKVIRQGNQNRKDMANE